MTNQKSPLGVCLSLSHSHIGLLKGCNFNFLTRTPVRFIREFPSPPGLNPLSSKSDQHQDSPCNNSSLPGSFIEQSGDKNYSLDHTRYNEWIIQKLSTTSRVIELRFS